MKGKSSPGVGTKITTVFPAECIVQGNEPVADNERQAG